MSRRAHDVTETWTIIEVQNGYRPPMGAPPEKLSHYQPSWFEVRRWEWQLGKAEPRPGCAPMTADTLSDARTLVPKGLRRRERAPEDDERLVETWL